MKNINLATILGVIIIIVGLLPFVMPKRVDPAEAEELKSEVSSLFEIVQDFISSMLSVVAILKKNEEPVQAA
jgi:hypothetical protein